MSGDRWVLIDAFVGLDVDAVMANIAVLESRRGLREALKERE
jgi:hypothetical protein